MFYEVHKLKYGGNTNKQLDKEVQRGKETCDAQHITKDGWLIDTEPIRILLVEDEAVDGMADAGGDFLFDKSSEFEKVAEVLKKLTHNTAKWIGSEKSVKR